MNRRRRTTLLALATLTIGVAMAACAPSPDKGNSAAPCCGATGNVEQPESAFAITAGGATFAGIQIKPVIYETSACPSFSDPDPLGVFLDMERAGKTTDVDSNLGTFQLQLTENALGRKVAFVACTDGCDEVVGIGLLGAPVVATAEGEFLIVAPIQLTSVTGALGPSTLEILADCELDSRDIRGSLVTADVRHVISDEVGYPASPTTGEVDDLMSRMTLFENAVDAYLAVSSDDAAVFASVREAAEAGVDSCISASTLPQGCSGTTAIASEFFRYYQFARAPVTPVPTPAPTGTAAPGPLPPEDNLLPFHLLLWTESLAVDLGPQPPAATDDLDKSLLKQNAMFRYELMSKAIADAVASTQYQDMSSGTDKPLSLTFSSAGLPSVNDSLATIRTAIETGSMDDPSSIYMTWGLSARDIGRNLDVQLSAQATGTFQTLMQSCFDIGVTMQQQLDGTETPQQAFGELYSDGTGNGGGYQQAFNAVGSVIVGHPLPQQLGLTDMCFFTATMSVPPVQLGFAPEN